MDRNEVIKKSDELLRSLGHYSASSSMESDDYCELDIPEHSLRIVRKHKTGETTIYHNDVKMFDRNINITGIWQQVLDECLNELEKQNKEQIKKTATCNIISRNLSYFVDGMDKLHTPQIATPLTNNILVQVYSHKDENHRDVTITSIYYNNEEVFTRIYKERYGNNPTPDREIEYPLYIPGKWEAKLEDLKNSVLEETKKVRHINNINN